MKKTLQTTLEKIIQGNVSSQKEIKKFYSVDASSYQIIPKIIVTPKNQKDIINTVKIATKFKVSVTVRGAGTSLVGSALNKGIILDMKNFNSIKISKNHVTVGSGVIKGILDKTLKKSNKFFPPNPSIGSFCAIGGMLGNNSSGSRSLKYGSVIDNVLEIKCVDGNGIIHHLPKNKKDSEKILKIVKDIDHEKIPKVTKNSSGYRIDKILTKKDSHKILIGSEGTLGVIISAKLKIQNIPKKRLLVIIEYDSISKAIENCVEINKTNPSAIEFVDKTTLKQIKFNFSQNVKSLLFIEYDQNITKNSKIIKKISQGKIVKITQKNSEMEKWWRHRDASLYYSLKSIKKENRVPHVIEDVSVPIESLSKLFLKLNEINKKYKTKSIAYGHAGNGNIHVRLITKRKNKKMIKKIATNYFEYAIKLKGTITAEHGDGLARSEFIKKQYGSKNYKIFKNIKSFFDPKNTLNPGKIITKKSTIIKNLENF